MPQPREDDLFRESTMTFGEHLEELRGCLFRSVIGLAIGLVVGLMVGGYVVEFIQRPLIHALTNFYDQESEKLVEKMGPASPWTPEQVKYRVETEGFLADEYYVDPAQVFEELKRVCPEPLRNVEPAAFTPKSKKDGETASAGKHGELVRLFLWHRSAKTRGSRARAWR